jgi:hypothetical protein
METVLKRELKNAGVDEGSMGRRSTTMGEWLRGRKRRAGATAMTD